MPRTRYAHRTGHAPKTTPFDTAEEAWFWAMRCLAMRRIRARLEHGGMGLVLSRPCDPDDLAACLAALVRRGRLTTGHVRVLAFYGAVERPPNPHQPGESGHAQLWEEALDRMTTVLRAKGIVRMPDEPRPLPPPAPVSGPMPMPVSGRVPMPVSGRVPMPVSGRAAVSAGAGRI